MGKLTQAWNIEILYLICVVPYISTQHEIYILPSNRLFSSKKEQCKKFLFQYFIVIHNNLPTNRLKKKINHI